jgi:hypothetical protein
MAAAIGLSTPFTAAAQKRRLARIWWLSYAGVLGLTVVIAAIAFLTAPAPLSLGVVLLIGLAAVILARPELGLWILTFFAVAGDWVTAPWYPVMQGMSSTRSMLFVSNSATVSPFELLLAATAGGWILHMAASRQWTFRRGALFRPVMVFSLFLVFGVVNGLARGGNRYVALWETRPLVALAVVYVLATNLCTGPASFRRLWSALMAAVVVDAAFAISYYFSLSSVARTDNQDLGEHAAALHANAYFVLLIAMGVMSARSRSRMVVMLIAAPIVGYAYILAERRSAFVGLVAGLTMLMVVLYRRRRPAFWYVAPCLALVFAGYLAVFWNSEGAPGFPAQAVKSVIAPGQLSDNDKGSDQFRVVENYNIVYTIRSQPLTGIGFGQQFLRPIPNADISFVQFWEYRTHNAVLWIWMQTGVGGFIAMLYLLAAAIRHGTRRVMCAAPGYDGALLLTSVVFVVMYAVFAYVDVAWDAESMVFLGIAFALIGNDALRDSPDKVDPGSAGTERFAPSSTRGDPRGSTTRSLAEVSK